MSHTAQKNCYGVVAALAFALLVTSPLAAQPTATLYLVDPGSGANLAGIYTSPYDGSINGGASVPIICDDFADETYQSESWTTFVTPFSSVTSEGTAVDNTLKWAGAGFDSALSQSQAYEAAAILSIDILDSASGSPTQQLYSYALWALFDPTGTSQNPGAITWLNNNGGSQYVSTIDGYVNTAIGDVTGNSVNGQSLSSYLGNYNVTIYSYDSAILPSGCGGTCPPPPQEFITVTTPEASTPVLLAVDLLGFMALVGFLRKRIGRTV
jgi:hypothetical protein